MRLFTNDSWTYIVCSIGFVREDEYNIIEDKYEDNQF